MRGKVLAPLAHRELLGITPAYAGKSHLTCDGVAGVYGSPPPMRGKDFFVVQPCTADRITPAYAGKRDKNTVYWAKTRDHPRLCGEKFAWAV